MNRQRSSLDEGTSLRLSLSDQGLDDVFGLELRCLPLRSWSSSLPSNAQRLGCRSCSSWWKPEWWCCLLSSLRSQAPGGIGASQCWWEELLVMREDGRSLSGGRRMILRSTTSEPREDSILQGWPDMALRLGGRGWAGLRFRSSFSKYSRTPLVMGG